MVKLHIGFDDTDSPNGGCTTYIAALLVEKLSNMGASFTDYPRLIRLNPNVPWKTRGNGALCLSIECPEDSVDRMKATVITTVEANSELGYSGNRPRSRFHFRGYSQRNQGLRKKSRADPANNRRGAESHQNGQRGGSRIQEGKRNHRRLSRYRRGLERRPHLRDHIV